MKQPDTITLPFAAIPDYLIREGTWARLKPASKAVLIVLCSFRGYRSNRCFPSWTTLSELAGINRSSVGAAIGDLVTHKVLEVESRGDSRKSAHYRLICFEPPIEIGASSDDHPFALPVESDKPTAELLSGRITRPQRSDYPTTEVGLPDPNEKYLKRSKIEIEERDSNSNSKVETKEEKPKPKGRVLADDPDYQALRSLGLEHEHAAHFRNRLTSRARRELITSASRKDDPAHWATRVATKHIKGECEPESCCLCSAPPLPGEVKPKELVKTKAYLDQMTERFEAEAQAGEARRKQYLAEIREGLASHADYLTETHKAFCNRLALSPLNEAIRQALREFREDMNKFDQMPVTVRGQWLAAMRTATLELRAHEESNEGNSARDKGEKDYVEPC